MATTVCTNKRPVTQGACLLFLFGVSGRKPWHQAVVRSDAVPRPGGDFQLHEESNGVRLRVLWVPDPRG